MQAARPDKRQLARQFSRSAGTYARHDGLQRLMNQALCEWLPHYERLLELGCGDGRILAELARRSPASWHLGLDLAQGMLRQLQQHAPQLPAVQADMEQLPLADASFDLIYSCATLQWTDPARSLAEAARVLQPGGTLLLASLVAGSLQEWHQAWQAADGGDRVHALPEPDVLLAELDRAGFELEGERCLEYCFAYASADEMLRDIKGLGGTHAGVSRPRGLLGRHTYNRFRAALQDLGCIARYRVQLVRAHKP